MTALIAGIPYELDIDAEDEADGTRYRVTWPGVTPECPACGNDVDPRPHFDPPRLWPTSSPVYFLACDCGQRYEVIQ
jgi:hypothetical protein